jgi:hypothetical protein
MLAETTAGTMRSTTASTRTRLGLAMSRRVRMASALAPDQAWADCAA